MPRNEPSCSNDCGRTPGNGGPDPGIVKRTEGAAPPNLPADARRPKTIPELAEQTGIPAHEILWHITAMKKYDLIVETGMCGEYYLYQRAEGAKL